LEVVDQTAVHGPALEEAALFTDVAPADRNLQYLARLMPGFSEGRARRLVDRFALPAGKTVSKLSRGNRTKLALVAALAHGPRLLLLDEPTAGVQPRVIEEIVDRLRAVSLETGLPLILVEHNIEMVTALCSRIYVMKNGTIATEIAPEEVHDESVVRSFLAI